MGFTVNDYYDMMRLFDEHPEWEAEFRKRIVSEQLLSLPDVVRELAQAEKRTEERLEEVAQRLEALVIEVRALTASVREIADTVRVLKDTVGGLNDTVGGLNDTVGGLNDTVGGLKGKMLEMEYARKVGAYFGPLVKKPRLVEVVELEQALEKVLAPPELKDLYLLDLLVKGRVRLMPEKGEVFLAVEISSVVDADDVIRAGRRAEFLRRAGYHAIAVAAGEAATEGARQKAASSGVVLLQDGNVSGWEEAVRV